MATTPKNSCSPSFKNDVLTSLRKSKAESQARLNASMRKVRIAFQTPCSQVGENQQDAPCPEENDLVARAAIQDNHPFSPPSRKHFFAPSTENEALQQQANKCTHESTENNEPAELSILPKANGLHDVSEEHGNTDKEKSSDESVSRENVDIEGPGLECNENKLNRYPQLPPDMTDLPWKEVKKYLGWNFVRASGLNASYQFYLPAPHGKPEKEGGVEGIDFVCSDLDQKRFTVNHCGWKGDDLFWRQHKKELEATTLGRRSRKAPKTYQEEDDTALTKTAAAGASGPIALDIDGEDNEQTVGIISLITPDSASQQPLGDAYKKRSVSQKKSTKPTSNNDSTDRPKSKSTKSSNKYAIDVLSRAGVGSEYVGCLANVISSSTSVCRSHLTEDDLAFLPLAERRAVWAVITKSTSPASKQQDRIEHNPSLASDGSIAEVRQFLEKAIPGIPCIDLDLYVSYFCRERYNVFGMENLEESDLPVSMPKAYKKRLLAATKSTTSNKKARKH